MKQPKNSTQMMMEILRDPEKAQSRFVAAQRLASGLMRLVVSEDDETITDIAGWLKYKSEQLRDDIIDLYELLGSPALS